MTFVLVAFAVIVSSMMGEYSSSNHFRATSTSVVEYHATTLPGSGKKVVTFQSDYSVAVMEYQHYKKSEDDVVRVHKIFVQRDPTNTWAKVNAVWSGANGGPDFVHIVKGRVVWVYQGGSVWRCPMSKAVCSSLERAHQARFVVVRVGNSVLLKNPITVNVTTSYLVWGSSCKDFATRDNAFFLDPQYPIDQIGWDSTLTSIEGQTQTIQGTTVPTCRFRLSGTLDYLPSESDSLMVCINTSRGYLLGKAIFDHAISPTHMVYSYVNSDGMKSGGLSYAQSCGMFAS